MPREDVERLDDQGMSAWDSHDTDTWVEMFADDFVLNDWTRPEPIRDRAELRAYFDAWITAFPDMRAKQTNRVVSEDNIAAEIEFTGTNTGPLVMGEMEMPPTNKSVVGRGAYFAQVRDGKVVEFSAHPDAAGLMMQLGLMPGS